MGFDKLPVFLSTFNADAETSAGGNAEVKSPIDENATTKESVSSSKKDSLTMSRMSP